MISYPRQPDPAGGKIIPYSVKGVTVYASPFEVELVHWLLWIGLGIFFLFSHLVQKIAASWKKGTTEHTSE